MARVLVVDDEPQIRKLLTAVLLRAGHHVDSVRDAHAATEAHQGPVTYDLVVSDVSMPGIDGHDLARWLAIHRPDCRVILMSASDDGCDACPFAPRCRILHKPFLPRHLLALIAESFGQGK